MGVIASFARMIERIDSHGGAILLETHLHPNVAGIAGFGSDPVFLAQELHLNGMAGHCHGHGADMGLADHAQANAEAAANDGLNQSHAGQGQFKQLGNQHLHGLCHLG